MPTPLIDANIPPAKPAVWAREDFDNQFASCQKPGCTHENDIVSIAPPCHTAPVSTRYLPAEGRLRVGCSVCGNIVGDIQIARKEPPAIAAIAAPSAREKLAILTERFKRKPKQP